MALPVQPATPSTESDHAACKEVSRKLPVIISDRLTRIDKKNPRLTAEQHREAVRVTAYYLAERRGFEPGHESEDWATAEFMVIDRAGLPVT